MSGRGVFAVDRGIWSDPDFADEPFTERVAFMWLVGEAAWKPYRKRADGKLVDQARGQLCHAVRFMADAWGWSKSRRPVFRPSRKSGHDCAGSWDKNTRPNRL